MEVTKSKTGVAPFRQLMQDRSSFQRAFLELLTAEPGLRGRVLDIGCGGRLPTSIASIAQVVGQLDGVDPDEAVLSHPSLTLRWQGQLEEVNDIPTGAYDLAYAYNVVEHIAEPTRFLATVCRILKPGGVFWALTPNGSHPFSRLSRTIEVLGGKRMAAKSSTAHINDYPAYYRLNRAGQLLAAAQDQNVKNVQLHYMPCAQWDQYFPRALRWGPNLFDLLLGSRFKTCMLVLAYRIEVGKPTLT